jgi:hypothetical protein
MKRYYRVVTTTALLLSGLGATGCTTGGGGKSLEDCYRNAVDVSSQDRYNYAAREAVLAPFAQQVATGHFLEQTLWNFYFVPGTDKLTPGGIDKLNTLARLTPAPDPRLYIQTARDISVTPENYDSVANTREKLNAERAAAIKKYMAAQPGAPVNYEVYVHDAPVPGIYSVFAGSAFRGQLSGYKGGIGGSTGTLVAGQQQSMQGVNQGGGAPASNVPGGSGSTPGGSTGPGNP